MAYATGKFAKGLCDRCGFEYKLLELKDDDLLKSDEVEDDGDLLICGDFSELDFTIPNCCNTSLHSLICLIRFSCSKTSVSKSIVSLYAGSL